ncbi:vascular endothelial growth factor A-like isoform X4 [Lethenteron reissneri]|uniref:vascular endothelial growth factor A-like isoform X4 n=1 Tax=Lethenteron reissneri TaxID=7753 RepID=UPI002AB71FA5|nr:vascular endothelial growth factor A-like isoform X4 [Lethenteron reissneri]UKB92861.1 vascular endothelial growth factor [Lethenteron reissneri]
MLSLEGHHNHSYQQQQQQQQHHHHHHHHHHPEGHVLSEGNMQATRFVLFLVVYVTPVLQAKSLASRRSVEVVPLERVMERSACMPRETLVSVSTEYPGDTDIRYHPSCVAIMRCSGCCNDETLECLPTAKSNVTLEVFKLNVFHSGGKEQMSFTQHDSCKCGCRPCSGPRLQQDPDTCRCSCRTVCKHKLQLNKHTCKCEKPRR